MPPRGGTVNDPKAIGRSEWDGASDVLRLLGDKCARAILTTANRRPVTAREMVDRCDVSETTVYRRIRALVEHGLLEERVALLQDSKQTTVYRTTFTHLEVLLDEGRFTVERHANEAARVTYLLSELPFETVSVDLSEGQVTARASFDEEMLDRLGALMSK